MKMWQIYPYDADIDLLGKRKYTVWVSAFFLTAAILLLALVGPRWGIDFQGGTEIIVQFDEVDRDRLMEVADDDELAELIGADEFDEAAFDDIADSVLAERIRESGQFDEDELLHERVEDEEVREAAEHLELAAPMVQRFGDDIDNQFLIQTRDVAAVGDDEYEAIIEQLEQLDHHHMTDPIEERPAHMEVRFDEEVSYDQIEQAVAEGGIEELQIYETGQDHEHWYMLEFQDLQRHFEEGLSEFFGDRFTERDGIQRLESVGPRAGEQLRNDGMLAMLVALVAILIYIWIRFDIRYSPGAIAALAHDITICLGLFVILDIEFSLPIVAALLTIIGYSLNDTIVVFDRIRENLTEAGGESVEKVANKAINQTMSRTLITSLTTLMAVTTIALVATGLIEDFAMALVVGVIVGTYSSVFVASPVMLKMDEYLKEREQTQQLLDEQQDEQPDPGAQV